MDLLGGRVHAIILTKVFGCQLIEQALDVLKVANLASSGKGGGLVDLHNALQGFVALCRTIAPWSVAVSSHALVNHVPSVSQAIRMPSLYTNASTDVPVT